MCQVQFKSKVDLRFVLSSVEVEIEVELVLKSCILYFCGRVGGCVGVGGVKKLTLKQAQLPTNLKLKLSLAKAK